MLGPGRTGGCRALGSGRSFGRSFGRSSGRSFGRSVVRSVGRPVGRSFPSGVAVAPPSVRSLPSFLPSVLPSSLPPSLPSSLPPFRPPFLPYSYSPYWPPAPTALGSARTVPFESRRMCDRNLRSPRLPGDDGEDAAASRRRGGRAPRQGGWRPCSTVYDARTDVLLGRTRERYLRSKFVRFAVFCNSRRLSHFAAFVFDGGPEVSIVVGCVGSFLLSRLWFVFAVGRTVFA